MLDSLVIATSFSDVFPPLPSAVLMVEQPRSDYATPCLECFEKWRVSTIALRRKSSRETPDVTRRSPSAIHRTTPPY